MGRIRFVKEGDIIDCMERESEMKKEKPAQYRIVQVSSHTVTGVSVLTGRQRVFDYGDLVMLGVERQHPKYEALRFEREMPQKARRKEE